MSNLLALTEVLKTLQLPYTQRSGELRIFCPFQHNIPAKSPSGSLYIDTGRFYCFGCKVSSITIGDFLVDLKLETRYLLKKHPESAATHKAMLDLISKAQEALEDFNKIEVSTVQ
jgi:hypothetical protein